MIPFAVAAVTAALQLAAADAPAAPDASSASTPPTAAVSASRPASRPARAPARAPARPSSPDPAPEPVREDPRDAIDVSDYPPEQKERYLLVREKCARCHGFARAVNTRLTVADWKRHLKKMAVRPNTAISDAQARAILEFLKFHASHR